jgi:hypothetical protein
MARTSQMPRTRSFAQVTQPSADVALTLDVQTAAVATVEASAVRLVASWEISHSRHLQSS